MFTIRVASYLFLISLSNLIFSADPLQCVKGITYRDIDQVWAYAPQTVQKKNLLEKL